LAPEANVQSKAKAMLHAIYPAQMKQKAGLAYQHFLDGIKGKYPRAVACLEKDQEDIFMFYEFPASHWIHIRTTNPIESTFATVLLRTAETKSCGSRSATLSMVSKSCRKAVKSWRRLDSAKWIPVVLERKRFVDGELDEQVA
jgi:putative transposase